MRKTIIMILAAVVPLAVFAPAQAEKVDTRDFSGWMQNYENLIYVEKRNAFIFTNEERRGNYRAILLGDVTVYGTNVEQDTGMAAKASDYMREGLVRMLREEGVLAEAPGPDVATLSIAITGAEKSVSWSASWICPSLSTIAPAI